MWTSTIVRETQQLRRNVWRRKRKKKEEEGGKKIEASKRRVFRFSRSRTATDTGEILAEETICSMAFSGTDALVIFVVWLASQANSARDTELLPSGEFFFFLFFCLSREWEVVERVAAYLGWFGEYLLLVGNGSLWRRIFLSILQETESCL